MKEWIKKGIVLVIAAALLGGAWQYRQQCMTEEIAGKIIRFHVRANSDTQADQELKLKVRDAVGAYMQPRLSGISDVAASRRVVKENLPGIERTASSVIAKEGYTYEVAADLTVTDFPEKTYGDYTFPAGTYEALEVVIGEGRGHNWWCVMYPNLCFFNSVYQVVDEEAEESLKKTLTPEEYKSLMEEKNYKVRFALAERIQEIFENL
ncbi:stage II sporulation protein R [Lachnospiraceae bacterium]|nr:stage II sporulation protein R [Lachnospiraceae bacterium]